MKKLTYAYLLLVYFLLSPIYNYGGITDFLKPFLREEERVPVFTSGVQQKKELLENLKNTLATLQTGQELFLDEIQQQLEKNKKRIAEIDERLGQEDVSEQEFGFLDQQKSLLSETNQWLVNQQLIYQEALSILEQHMKKINNYLKDPEFKLLQIDIKSFYGIAMLKKASKDLLAQETTIERLKSKKDKLSKERERIQKLLAVSKENYEKNKKKQEEFATKTIVPEKIEDTSAEFDFKQRGQLLNLKVELYEAEKSYQNLHLKKIDRDIALLDSELFIEEEKGKILKENLAKVKRRLQVDENDVRKAKENYDAVKQESIKKRRKIIEQIKQLVSERDSIKKELAALGITDVNMREQISCPPTVDTPSEYLKESRINEYREKLILLNRRIDHLNSNIDHIKIKELKAKINQQVTESWLKLTQGLFKDNEEVMEEVNFYEAVLSDINRDLSTYRERRNMIAGLLDIQNKRIQCLKDIISTIQEQEKIIFKTQSKIYKTALENFYKAIEIVKKQKNIISQEIEKYASIASNLNTMYQGVITIKDELKQKSLWQRSEYAISWQGFKNIIPDIKRFIFDIRHIALAYITGLRWHHFTQPVKDLFGNLGHLILVILGLIALCIFFIVVRRYLPRLKNKFIEYQPDFGMGFLDRVLFVISKMIAALLLFIERYFFCLFVWLVLLIGIHIEIIQNVFPQLLFYVLSIPYFLYLTPRFVHIVLRLNEQLDYAVFSKSLEKRFAYVCTIFAFLTIIVLFFREAFILATIHKSELPKILDAFWSIFVKILAIFLFGKDEIISLLPSKGAIWEWLAGVIKKYYYAFLACIISLIVLSDPYVGGYQNLVWYIFWGCILTILLLWALALMQRGMRKLSSVIFFYSEDDTLKERFGYAKSWYGLFTILSLIVLSVVGILAAFWIWDIPINWEGFRQHILEAPLFRTGDTPMGEPDYFTPYELFGVVLLILGGVFLSYAINRFVMRRIFDLFPVNVGVQHTMLGLTRIFVIVLSVLVAFLWANLGTMIIAIGALIVSIGYIVREPLSDFVSYFIILVQRPIQIGDYIMIDEEKQGVVRRITPRSVILRRKNSFTLIVPNSLLISQAINNWNYARNFVAFDDILFTVPYTANPDEVKKIIGQVLDKDLHILKSPHPVIRLTDFGESGFVFLVRGFITDKLILDKWDIASDVRFNIVKALREHGIKIAVPTRFIISAEKEKIG